jgi:hypothetical protein
MGKEPERKRSDAEYLSYAKDWLNAFRAQREAQDTREHDISLDPEMLEAILVEFIVMKEAAQRRRGRAPHRPRENKLGEAVRAQIERGLSPSEARRTVAEQTGKNLRTVGQAHRRLLQRNLPTLHRRK